MNKTFAAALVALPLLALPVRADFHLPSYKIDAGVNWHCNIVTPADEFAAQCGPWYLYWPLEAHFQAPALPHYPYWPAPMALESAPLPPFPPPPKLQPTPVPPVKPAYYQPPTNQPVGYYYQQAPGYWYGR
jgi:hypothetical protein